MRLIEAKEILKDNGFLLEYEEEHGFCVGNNVYKSKEQAIEILKSQINDYEDKLEYDPKYAEYIEDAKNDLEAIYNDEGYNVHIDPVRGCWVKD